MTLDDDPVVSLQVSAVVLEVAIVEPAAPGPSELGRGHQPIMSLDDILEGAITSAPLAGGSLSSSEWRAQSGIYVTPYFWS